MSTVDRNEPQDNSQSSWLHADDHWASEYVAEDGGDLVSGDNRFLEFDPDGYVDVGDAMYLPNNSAFTVTGWHYYNVLSDRDMLLSRNHLKDGPPYAWLLGTSGGSDIRAWDGSSWHTVNHSFTTETWYHLAFVFDGTGMKFYVDGNHVGTSSWSFSDDAAYYTKIGGYSGTTGDINGLVSDVRGYDQALSDSDISDIYNKNDVTATPIHHWKLDEGSGGAANDSAGNKDGNIIDGTWIEHDCWRISNPLSLDSIKDVAYSNIKWTSTEPTNTNLGVKAAVTDSDWIGSLEFGGGGNHVEAGKNNIPFGTQNRTFTAWIKPYLHPDPEESFIFGYGTRSDYEAWDVRFFQRKVGIEVHGKGQLSNLAVPLDEWSFVAVVLDGNRLEDHIIYVNDNSENIWESYPMNTGNAFGPIIGAGAFTLVHGMNRWFEGKIDDVRLYSRALSASEISDLHQGNEISDAGLAGHWKLDEGSGSVAGDSSGNNNDGAINGATWQDWKLGDPLPDWQNATNDADIPGISENDDLSGKYLWVRQDPQTADATATPKLSSLEYSVMELPEFNPAWAHGINQQIGTGLGI